MHMDTLMNPTEDAFDSTDRQILAMLHRDGRTPNNEIARVLSISEGTVRNRIKKLIDQGSLNIIGLINPDYLPDKQLVLLEVKVALSRDLDATAARIAEFPEVVSVSIITGRMDMMVEVFVDTKFGLMAFVDDQLSTVEGIVSTESHVVMKHYRKWLHLENI